MAEHAPLVPHAEPGDGLVPTGHEDPRRPSCQQAQQQSQCCSRQPAAAERMHQPDIVDPDRRVIGSTLREHRTQLRLELGQRTVPAFANDEPAR